MPESFDEAGSTPGRLSVSGWKLDGGWLLPLTRGRLVWYDGSFSGEMALPGKFDTPGMLFDGFWYQVLTQSGGKSVLVSVELISGKVLELSEITIPVTLHTVDSIGLTGVSAGSKIIRIDRKTGKFLWKYQLPVTAYCSAISEKDGLIAGITTAGNYFNLDATTGKVVNMESLPFRIERILLFSEVHRIFQREGSDEVYSLNPDFTVRSVRGASAKKISENTLTVSGTTMYGTSLHGTVFTIDLESAEYQELTTISSGSSQPVLVINNQLWIAGHDGNVWVVDLNGQAPNRSFPIGGPPATGVLPFANQLMIQRKDHEWLISR